MENVCSCFKAYTRGCCLLAGFSFPEPPLFALKVPLLWGQGSAQWSRNAFLLWNLISLLSDCYSWWSYDSTQDLWDFGLVGHEGSRSTCLPSCKNRSVGFAIIQPRASVRIPEHGRVWPGQALPRWVSTHWSEQPKGLNMGNSGYTVLSALPQRRSGEPQNSGGKGSSPHVMALPMSGQGQRSTPYRASVSHLVLPTGKLLIRWF